MTASHRTLLRRATMTLAALLTALLALRSVYGWRAGRRLLAATEAAEQSWKRLAPPPAPRAPLPDGDNRAKVVEAATAVQVVEPRDALLLTSLTRFAEAGFLNRNREALARVIDRNRLVFDLLRHAEERLESDWGIYFLRGEAHLPNFIALLRLGRLVSARAQIAAQGGDMGQAVANLEQGYLVSGTFAKEGFVIMQMIRAAIDRMNHGALRALLVAGDPDAADLQRMSRLVAQSTDRADFVRALAADLARVDGLIAAVENGTAPESPHDRCPEGVTAWLLRPLIMDDHRRALSFMDASMHAIGQSPYQRAEAAETRFEKHALYLKCMRPLAMGFQTGRARADLAEARKLVAQTALALRRYRLDHGRYPETLTALAPSYLPAPPIDPFTGRLPEYRRQGAGFLLRSAGDADDRAASSVSGDKVLRWEVPR